MTGTLGSGSGSTLSWNAQCAGSQCGPLASRKRDVYSGSTNPLPHVRTKHESQLAPEQPCLDELRPDNGEPQKPYRGVHQANALAKPPPVLLWSPLSLLSLVRSFLALLTAASVVLCHLSCSGGEGSARPISQRSGHGADGSIRG